MEARGLNAVGKGSRVQECRQPLDAGRGNQCILPWSLQKVLALRYLDFSAVKFFPPCSQDTFPPSSAAPFPSISSSHSGRITVFQIF